MNAKQQEVTAYLIEMAKKSFNELYDPIYYEFVSEAEVFSNDLVSLVIAVISKRRNVPYSKLHIILGRNGGIRRADKYSEFSNVNCTKYVKNGIIVI